MLTNVNDSMLVMQEEIFGPLLPILPYDTLTEAIRFIKQHPHPLALYYFDHDRDNIARVLNETLSGGVTINDTLLHAGQESLPFGGIGSSGLGQYHGREGFNTFSKLKPVYHQSPVNLLPWIYPPLKKISKLFFNYMSR